MKKKILFLTLSIAILVGCKKYEDGPFISFRTKRARVEGNWNVTLYSYGNFNLLGLLNNSLLYNCQNGGYVLCNTFNQITNFKMQFTKTGKYSWHRNTTSCIVNENKTINTCSPCYDTIYNYESYNGRWRFNDDKTELTITNFIFNPFIMLEHPVPPSSHHLKTIKWNIIELRENQMKLKFSINSIPRIIILEKE